MKTILFLWLLLSLFSEAQQTFPYKNLALEGGGIRGIAYAGAFEVLEEKGILQNIEKVAGSSAGAIAGMMLCTGYTPKEIDSMLNSISFQKFNDGKGGLIGKYKRVKKKFGLYKGDEYEKWVRSMLKQKTGNPDLSFRGLHALHLGNKNYRDLYCTGTNISRQRLEIFSYETTPDFSIATAVRISGGIPLYFAPIALDDQLQKIKKGDTLSFINYYADGGMICNYPISMFDTCETDGNPLLCDRLKFNPETLGIKLERQEQIDSFQHNFSTVIPPYQPKNFSQYLAAFTNLTMEIMARKYPSMENERNRTVYISYGNINPRIRKMNSTDRKILYENGIAGVKKFFEK